MPLPANVWPALSTTLGNKSRTLNKHIVNIKHDINQSLNHINKNQARVSNTLIDFIKFIQKLVIEAL